MARVIPFKAIRYARPAGADITPLTAPPYDVISPEMRQRLLERDPHNVVALELPEGDLSTGHSGNRYDTGGRRWREWRAEGVLAADPVPAVYVLEQRYHVADRELVRRGFVAAVGLEPFDAGVVLPHERTLPKAIEDRLNMTRATAANLSQVFGMFSDPERVTDELARRAVTRPPLASAVDDDGVVSTLWAIEDPADHANLAAAMADKQIFIADGHHRYTTALAYRDEMRAAAGDHERHARPAYDSVMMALVNMDDPGLVVRPTHRIADAPGPFDPVAFRDALSRRFELTELPKGHPSAALEDPTGPARFIVRTRDGVSVLARLRTDVDHSDAYPPGSSDAWRALDVATLQELVLSPLLGIHPDRPETLDRLAFSKDPHAAMKAADDHDAVFILRPTRMDQVAAVATAGETMPQKSTYFHPKLLSGLLFKSLDGQD